MPVCFKGFCLAASIYKATPYQNNGKLSGRFVFDMFIHCCLFFVLYLQKCCMWGSASGNWPLFTSSTWWRSAYGRESRLAYSSGWRTKITKMSEGRKESRCFSSKAGYVWPEKTGCACNDTFFRLYPKNICRTPYLGGRDVLMGFSCPQHANMAHVS